MYAECVLLLLIMLSFPHFHSWMARYTKNIFYFACIYCRIGESFRESFPPVSPTPTPPPPHPQHHGHIIGNHRVWHQKHDENQQQQQPESFAAKCTWIMHGPVKYLHFEIIIIQQTNGHLSCPLPTTSSSTLAITAVSTASGQFTAITLFATTARWPFAEVAPQFMLLYLRLK